MDAIRALRARHSPTADSGAGVAILTVNYNGAAFIDRFIASLSRLEAQDWRLIVVDCRSTDGSADRIGALMPGATLIRLPENRGITGGHNRGIRAALACGVEHVLFLNPDTEADPRLLDELLKFASARRLVAPCVLLARQRTLMDDTVGDFDWRRGVWRGQRYGRPRPAGFDPPRRAAMASLTCLLVPAAALRALGGVDGPWMDERYFMYYDDFDFVRRLRTLGYELIYAPQALVYHRKSAAGGGVDSPFKHYYATRNRLLLMRSASSVPFFCGFFLYFLSGRAVRAAQTLGRGRPGVAWAILRGVVDFLAGRSGRTVLPGRAIGLR